MMTSKVAGAVQEVAGYSRKSQVGTVVLGLEIGYSTMQDVENMADAAEAELEGDEVTQKEAVALEIGHAVLLREGEFGIEGLHAVRCLFDSSGSLAMLQMLLDFNRFRDVYGILSEKYEVQDEMRPHHGNRYARLSAPGTVIEVEADFIDAT